MRQLMNTIVRTHGRNRNLLFVICFLFANYASRPETVFASVAIPTEVIDDVGYLRHCASPIVPESSFKAYFNDVDILDGSDSFICANGDRFIDDLTIPLLSGRGSGTLRIDFYSGIGYQQPIVATAQFFFMGGFWSGTTGCQPPPASATEVFTTISSAGIVGNLVYTGIPNCPSPFAVIVTDSNNQRFNAGGGTGGPYDANGNFSLTGFNMEAVVGPPFFTDGTYTLYIFSRSKDWANCALNFVCVNDTYFTTFYRKGGVWSATAPAGAHSNVLFLPGFAGSRLYEQGIPSHQRWIASNDVDMCKLRPNDDGSSTPGIYIKSGDIVDFALGVFDKYGGFITFMNGLQSSGFLHEWRAIPYDWRLNVEDIARNGINLQAGIVSLVSSVDELSSSSYTGKVTIVTHSNGGLLVKELLNVLVEQGKAGKIDRIIMVASPQLGTPKAIASLLHGDNPFDLVPFVDDATAREAGENMIGALNLMPSPVYFDRVGFPVIEFDPAPTDLPELVTFRKIYGNNISSYGTDTTGLRSFLLGAGGRAEPYTDFCIFAATKANIREPNVLRKRLVDRVKVLHTQEDAWQPPFGIDLFQVAGTGLLTLRGIRYTSERLCQLSCQPVLAHSRLDTFDGDGTVFLPSATALPVKTFYLNLPSANTESGGNREHSSIMTDPFIQQLIRELLNNNQNPTIHNIRQSKPISSNAVRMILHSPVAINAYDSNGHHTGPAPNPDPESQFPFFEQQIPNSSLERFGGDTYLTLDTNQEYQIALDGLALGTFTLTLEEYSNDAIVSTVNYVDVPVSPLTKGQLSVQHVAGSTLLQLDVDGDGNTDLTVLPGDQPNIATLLNILTKIVKKALGLSAGLQNSLTSKLDAATSAINRGNKTAASNMLAAFKNEVEAQEEKQISTSTGNSLIGIVNTLIAVINR